MGNMGSLFDIPSVPEPDYQADVDLLLRDEEKALRDDSVLYLECMNDKPLKDRKTPKELRDGLLLYWQVYRVCKSV